MKKIVLDGLLVGATAHPRAIRRSLLDTCRSATSCERSPGWSELAARTGRELLDRTALARRSNCARLYLSGAPLDDENISVVMPAPSEFGDAHLLCDGGDGECLSDCP